MSYEDYFRHRNLSAADYENYRLPAYMAAALPRDRGARILDIGCGFGQILVALREAGYGNAEGVDVSTDAVEHCAKADLKVTRIDDLLRFCQEQGNPTFDLVVMSHVLEHIGKSRIIETLAAIRKKLLLPAGALLVMVPNAQSNTGCYWAYEDFTHETLFTAGSLGFVLKSAGFDRVEFLDPKGFAASGRFARSVKKILLPVYDARIRFWNLVTSSEFHRPSPVIYTFEIRALARMNPSADFRAPT